MITLLTLPLSWRSWTVRRAPGAPAATPRRTPSPSPASPVTSTGQHIFDANKYIIYNIIIINIMSRFRVTAVNRIGDSEPLTSELIAVAEGVDSLVR